MGKNASFATTALLHHILYYRHACTHLGGIISGHHVHGGFLRRLPCQYRTGSIPDEEGGRERVAPQDGEVEETVAIGVQDVQVALVTH